MTAAFNMTSDARHARILLGALALLALSRLAAAQSACPPPDSLAPWARVSRAWSAESGQRWSNDSLRQLLIELRDQDQLARRDFGARFTDSAYVRQVNALDSVNARAVTEILDRHGLPTRPMVGARGADAVMLVVQHSASLQERVLALAQALPEGEISGQWLALLEDRVLVHRGKPQRFGTQFTIGADTLFHFAPVADTAGLETRRAQAGLPPLQLYVCWMEEAGMRINRRSLPRR